MALWATRNTGCKSDLLSHRGSLSLIESSHAVMLAFAAHHLLLPDATTLEGNNLFDPVYAKIIGSYKLRRSRPYRPDRSSMGS